MIDIIASFPVFVSDNLDSLKLFYSSVFGFEVAFFQADFYLHLAHPASGTQLGFLMPDHPSQPEFLQQLVSQQGYVNSFEVKDASQAYAQAQQQNLPIAMALKEEPWGQVHFMVKDPQGFVIDVVEHRAP